MRILVLSTLILAASSAAFAQTQPIQRYSDVQAGDLRTPVGPTSAENARNLANATRCGGTSTNEYEATQTAPGVVTRPAGAPVIQSQQRAYTDLMNRTSRSARAFAESNTSGNAERDQLGETPCP